MGGKKKSLANRLAKMSDEQRARYFQKKTEQEEETKKRREQLICTFMKIKIKKEDGFAKLNLAKINQSWHQILRRTKCDQMKTDVEEMKINLEHILFFKNRYIDNLLKELEWCEEMYGKNFQTHITHIDNIIDSHNTYLDTLHSKYDEDLNGLLRSVKNEFDRIKGQANESLDHLQTLMLLQDLEFEKSSQKNLEYRREKLEDYISSCRLDLEKLETNRLAVSDAICQQIANLIETYIERDDRRRWHYIELKRLDSDSRQDIGRKQDNINFLEKQVISLENYLTQIVLEGDQQIKGLENEFETKKIELNAIKKRINLDLEVDKKNLIHLTEQSKHTLNYFTDLKDKGENLVKLHQICGKYESLKEKNMKIFTPKKTDENNPDLHEKFGEIYNNLECLENFWSIYNQIDLDYRIMKEEKAELINENSQLEKLLRNYFNDVNVHLDVKKCQSAPPTKRCVVVNGAL